MKPVPRSYGVSGELKPVKPNSYGVVNVVSVLVSVADPSAPLSLLQSQLRLEARVGIERIPPFTSHSKSIVYFITAGLKIKAFSRCVKHNFNQLKVTSFYSILLSTNEVCWHICWHWQLAITSGSSNSRQLDY